MILVLAERIPYPMEWTVKVLMDLGVKVQNSKTGKYNKLYLY